MHIQTHQSSTSRPPFDVVLIGASWGGVTALKQLISSLPANFPVPLVIVQHRSNVLPYMLDNVLSQDASLAIVNASTGVRPQAGAVYLAMPDQHLLFDARGHFKITETERVNFVRPSIDVLFKSAAQVFRDRVLAVILTGKGNDGAEGARAIKRAGGIVIVQDKLTSEAFDMPMAAIQTQQIDFVLPLSAIGPALVTLTMVRGATAVFRVPVFPSIYLTEAGA